MCVLSQFHFSLIWSSVRGYFGVFMFESAMVPVKSAFGPTLL